MKQPNLSDDDLLELEIARQLKENRLFQYKPYGLTPTLCPDGELWRQKHELDGWIEWSNRPWQLDFHNIGKDHPERLLMCANGVGKTHGGAHEVALHMTGMYPDWWEGFRFNKATYWWIGTISTDSQKDFTQPALLGKDLRQSLGTGAVPKRLIAGKPSVRTAGTVDVVDSFFVRHVSGELSRGQFKSYKQGMRAWMGAPPDGIWLDEQPDDNSLDERGIYEECQTRVIRTSGIILCTLTPILGETDLTRHFMRPKSKGIGMVGATWDDVAHLKQDDKDRLVATYGKHSLRTRTKGVPMMGEGKVFDAEEEDFVLPENIDQDDWPPHWWYIAGIDFGIDHPTAFVWMALDRDKDIVYLLDDYRRSGVTDPIIHLPEVRRRGGWIPIAWPHDGENRILHRGATLKISQLYREAGFNMLGRSARYKKDDGGPQPISPVILDINQRMKTGGFKVAPRCVHFLEEQRSFHIKDGKYSALREDTLKACFYGMMDLSRCGVQKGMMLNPREMRSSSMPLVGARV